MSGSVLGTSGASLPKRPHLESGNEAHMSGKKSAGALFPPVLLSQEGKVGMGVSTPDVPQPFTSSSSSSSTSAMFQVGMLFNFFDQWRSITFNRFVLNRFGATIFSLDPVLPCSVTSGTLMSRQLQLINLLFRRKLMSFLLRGNRTLLQWCWFLF